MTGFSMQSRSHLQQACRCVVGARLSPIAALTLCITMRLKATLLARSRYQDFVHETWLFLEGYLSEWRGQVFVKYLSRGLLGDVDTRD